MIYDRPLDLLNASKRKQVLVELQDKRQFVGELQCFDIHINIVLNNAREIVGGEQKINYGNIFFRGDAVVFISPAADRS